MGSGNDNFTQIVDGAQYFVGDGQTTVELLQIESHNTTDEGSVANVTSPSGVIGTARSAGGFTISLKSRRSKGVEPEVDWESIRDGDGRIRFEIQHIGGKRHQFPAARVASVNDSASAAGEVSADISLTAPTRRIL